MHGWGAWTLTGPSRGAIELEFELDRVRLHRSPDMLLRGSGRLRCEGYLEAPRLVGQIEIVRGIYHRNVYPSLEAGSSEGASA